MVEPRNIEVEIDLIASTAKEADVFGHDEDEDDVDDKHISYSPRVPRQV